MARLPLGRALAIAAALPALLLATASTAFAYRFFLVSDLAREAEQHVGTKIKVVDTLVKIWQEQELKDYLRFDTTQFRCAVPTSETESIAYIREVLKNHDERKVTIPPLVAIYGTLSRAPLWGRVAGGEEQGVASEQIVIIVDRVERPRDRFWEEGY